MSEIILDAMFQFPSRDDFDAWMVAEGFGVLDDVPADTTLGIQIPSPLAMQVAQPPDGGSGFRLVRRRRSRRLRRAEEEPDAPQDFSGAAPLEANLSADQIRAVEGTPRVYTCPTTYILGEVPDGATSTKITLESFPIYESKRLQRRDYTATTQQVAVNTTRYTMTEEGSKKLNDVKGTGGENELKIYDFDAADRGYPFLDQPAVYDPDTGEEISPAVWTFDYCAIIRCYTQAKLDEVIAAGTANRQLVSTKNMDPAILRQHRGPPFRYWDMQEESP
jgi:hypothetical protein